MKMQKLFNFENETAMFGEDFKQFQKNYIDNIFVCFLFLSAIMLFVLQL